MVGIGPGAPLDRTRRAEETLATCRVIVGYTAYLERIKDLTADKELIGSGMTKEVERCRAALLRAHEGDDVALVSSGDAGVYGMAGLALEMVTAMQLSVPVSIVPGVSAAHAAAARMGAPLMLDCAFISLSDLLVPWETIERRLKAVAAADLVVTLYNPRSKRRIKQLDRAVAIFREHRAATTVVGIATSMGASDECVTITDLEHLLEEEIGMTSTVIVGNTSSTKMGDWFVTPRGYRL